MPNYSVAPNCYISKSQQTPFPRGMQREEDPLANIPRANDLRSALHALNQMAKIIADILHRGPQVNNIRQSNPPDEKEKGQDYNPHYSAADWVHEHRVYKTQKLRNPEDQQQYIEIKTLQEIWFFNQNTAYRLKYGE